MTTVLNVSLSDMDAQFLQDLKKQYVGTTEVEIRLHDKSPAEALFSENDFWDIINAIEWDAKTSQEKVYPAIQKLSAMPVSAIYIFADKLSEKLYRLDTRLHAESYSRNEPNHFISVDDFLYARCAVISEGPTYYEKVLNDPTQMPDNIVFEPLLSLADDAYELKTSNEFNYVPLYNYETRSNLSGWQ